MNQNRKANNPLGDSIFGYDGRMTAGRKDPQRQSLMSGINGGVWRGWRLGPLSPFLIKFSMPSLFAYGIALFAGRNLVAWCICLPMVAVLIFMVTLAQIRKQGNGIAVKRFIRWRKVSRSEIVQIGQSNLSGTGFVQLNRYVFPWGRIYFQLNWADKGVLDAMSKTADLPRP